MAKLQACAKCGAQFDVSAMALGTAFTCGACGAVVTVGAPVAVGAPMRSPPAPAASRAIPAPAASGSAGRSASSVGSSSVMGRAPAAAPVTKSGRGPQYQPVERHREATATPKGREAEGGRASRGRAARSGAGRKPGLSPAAMAGVAGAGLLVIGGLAFALFGGKGGGKGDAPTSTSGTLPVAGTSGSGNPAVAGTSPGAPAATGTAAPAPAATDTVATVDAEYRSKRHWSNDDLKRFFQRFKALGESASHRTKEVAELIVREGDANYVPARQALGHREFAHEVPEIIAFTGYPYIRAVEEAAKQRWFGPDEEREYEIAMRAWAKTQAHAKKLDPDHGDSTFRALDGARREISRNTHFKDYNYEAIFASPYLICYSSEDRLTEEDLLSIPKNQRQAKLAEMEQKREGYMRILGEKAKIYQQLYTEFLKRYGEDCEVRDLMGPYGGRPDLPASKRSFKDGCPLIIWIFSDRNAFKAHHDNVVKSPIGDFVAGYFSPATGWVYLYDEADNREFEINKNVHEGTHQLEHWFSRQKREWGPTRTPQSFFGEGFAEYVGAVNMAKDRTLTFHGVNRPRVEFLKGMEQQMKAQSRKLLIFPTKVLVGFEGYHKVREWTADNWKMDGLGVFYAQSWAFVYFLNEAHLQKYKAKFNGYIEDILNHPLDDAEGYGFKMFAKRFNLKTDADWQKLHAEFEKFYLETIIPMDLSKLGGQPPSLSDWPGYVPVEPVDPTK